MKSILITNGTIINEGSKIQSDIYIKNGFIEKIGSDLAGLDPDQVIDANGKMVIPGLIDDQVHFREPGLTHKATIKTESKAAVAGGVTSYLEMPNTQPQTLTQELLEKKYQIGARDSLANYSFYMGASNDNLEEVLKTDPKRVCGVKVFMGSSTGNMLVDNQQTLENIFSQVPMLIATHCEDEQMIRENLEKYQAEFGADIPIQYHPFIRPAEACFKSSSLAVSLAQKYGAKLHVLHISTEKELSLFRKDIPLAQKNITAEACIHHLWFDDRDYQKKGTLIKWNPAVKKESDKQAIFRAILDDTIDVIATDHAPHTLEEKRRDYTKSPSGGPLVQHSLVAMLEFYRQGEISLEKIVEKMCHNPAELFRIDRRGFIREGFHADLVIIDPDSPWEVNSENILAKCGWSPFEGVQFRSRISHTIVSGHIAYTNGIFNEEKMGDRLTFQGHP